MSVLIKCMEMPIKCAKCPIADISAEYYFCEKIDWFGKERPSDCPLIELPPHGRLADFDKIIEDYWDGNHMEIDENDLKAISKYKVIIEAERSKANDTH